MNRNATSRHAFYAACISGVLTLAIGITLTAVPGILITVCKAAGTLLCIAGLVLIVQYFLPKFQNSRLLTYGVIAIIAGVLLLLIPGLLHVLVPLVFGIWMILNSLSGILRNVGLRGEHRFWWIGVILSGIGCILGAYIVTRPTETMDATVRIIGIALIIFAVLRLVSVLMARQYFGDEPTGDVIDVTINEEK